MVEELKSFWVGVRDCDLRRMIQFERNLSQASATMRRSARWCENGEAVASCSKRFIDLFFLREINPQHVFWKSKFETRQEQRNLQIPFIFSQNRRKQSLGSFDVTFS